MTFYSIQFIPNIKDRQILNNYKHEFSKITKSIEALRFPVHMSLISSKFKTRNINSLIKELKYFAKSTKPFAIKPYKNISIMKNIDWCGLNFSQTTKINNLRSSLQDIRNKFATINEKHLFKQPHITLSFKTDVSKLKVSPSPMKELLFDRITILSKEKKSDRYTIFKHIKLGE